MAKFDYPYIRAWGKMMSSGQYYIIGEIEKARKDNAPQDATFWSITRGEWATFSTITNENTKRLIEQLVKEFQK